MGFSVVTPSHACACESQRTMITLDRPSQGVMQLEMIVTLDNTLELKITIVAAIRFRVFMNHYQVR